MSSIRKPDLPRHDLPHFVVDVRLDAPTDAVGRGDVRDDGIVLAAIAQHLQHGNDVRGSHQEDHDTQRSQDLGTDGQVGAGYQIGQPSQRPEREAVGRARLGADSAEELPETR